MREELAALWEKISDLEALAARVILEQEIPLLVDKYGLMAGALAADWFELLTGEPGYVPDSYRVRAWQASTRWALTGLFQQGVDAAVKAAVFDRLASATTRHVKQHGRDTIDESVKRTPGVFYARKTMGETCDFCVMLASRGPVYGSELDAGGDGNRYHDDCDCVPVPVKGRWVADDATERGARWVGDDPGYDFEKLYDEEYKPYWQDGDAIEEVLKRRRLVLGMETGERSGDSESLTDGLVPYGEKKKPRSKAKVSGLKKESGGYIPAKITDRSVWSSDKAWSLENVVDEQGWHGPIEQLSDKEFDVAARDSQHPLIYRGLHDYDGRTSEELNMAFLNEDSPWIGGGVKGDGWYTTTLLDTARQYAGKRGIFGKLSVNDDADRSDIGGAILEMVLRPEAKVVSLKHLLKKGMPIEQSNQASLWAAQMGFDAVRIPTPRTASYGEYYYLVVNRTALIAREMT